MKKYLAVYLGSPDAFDQWQQQDDATRKEKEKRGGETWMRWVQSHQKQVVDMGAPLGKTKRIDRAGVSDTRNAITAYTIVSAETHEAAAKLFLEHPHFTIFPGSHVEVMEFVPMPGV